VIFSTIHPEELDNSIFANVNNCAYVMLSSRNVVR